MRRVSWRRCAEVGLTAAVLAFTSGAALANVVVLESDVLGIQRGQDLSDERVLVLPFGTHLLVLASQDNKLKTIQINGPRSGKVKDLLGAQPIPQRLMGAVMRALQTGGADQTGVAGSRGFPIVVADVGVDRNTGVVCVREGALPLVGVPRDSGKSVNISDQQGTRSASLEVSLSGSPATWPDSVPIHDGAHYRIIPSNSPQVGVKIRLVSSETLSDASSVHALETLDERGCKQQVDAAVRKIVGAR
jgi:hypothetical protein